MKVKNKELRKKLANSIMLVGGTSKLKGFIDFLEERLINKLSELDNEIERVEIFNYPEIDMKTLSWIGGSILPKLESSKDMWIQKERWLGEPEKMEEQIDNNIEINKKEGNNGNNNEKKKENDNENDINNSLNNSNNNIEVGSQDEKSKNGEKNKDKNSEKIDMVIEKDEKEEKDKDKDKEKNKDKKEGDNKKKDDNKKKKVERHLDGGIVLLREKCPFPW